MFIFHLANKIIIQCLKSLVLLAHHLLSNVINARFLTNDSDILHDLGINDIEMVIKCFVDKYEARLHQHIIIEAIQFLENDNLNKSLKRTKPIRLAL